MHQPGQEGGLNNKISRKSESPSLTRPFDGTSFYCTVTIAWVSGGVKIDG